MDQHHNWWGIGFMVFMTVMGISLLLILIWRERRDSRREWYCEADAVGLHGAGYCTPENPIHSSPCGWMEFDKHGKMKRHG